ncbi:hypothetical protein [Sphingomonas sp. KR3-1]|uniref:hypothetical protein n=1 Tax=Sphingomonas sp. KR3-1 TaxID=3156611 RepID=UPI0032B36C41
MLGVLQILGAIGGLAALGWRLLDELSAYLRISLSVSVEKGWVLLGTTVENKGFRDKRISNALLVIGPEDESPIATVNALIQQNGDPRKCAYTNDFARIDRHLAEGDRMVIPLPYYFGENIAVADETLNYTAPVSTDALAPNLPYAVRFFLFGPNRLHRSTQNCFVVVPPAEPGPAA